MKKMENQAITTDEFVDKNTAAELTEKVTGEIMSQLEANEKKMRHYTEFIPKDLGIDLQKAGMPIDWEDNSPDEHPNTDVHCLTTYAEVMDWFMERGIHINIQHRWLFCAQKVKDYLPIVDGLSYNFYDSWHSAANTAIEQAIKLLEETQKH